LRGKVLALGGGQGFILRPLRGLGGQVPARGVAAGIDPASPPGTPARLGVGLAALGDKVGDGWRKFKSLGEDDAPQVPTDTDEAAALFDAEGIATEVVEELLASAAQVKKIQTLMGEAGIKDRTQRLNFIQEKLGLEQRPASTNVLTASQAHTLIDLMEKGS
jgi:hypothetical protein